MANVIHQGHRVKVKVKVTGAKKHACSRVICLRMKGNFVIIIITVTIAVVICTQSIHKRHMKRKRTQSARECENQ